MRRVTITDAAANFSMWEDLDTLPQLVDVACIGLAIAPESNVRACEVRDSKGRWTPLRDGSPLILPERHHRISVRPLEPHSGDLVLVLAEVPEQLQLLPTYVTQHTVVHGRSRGGADIRLRASRPRGIVTKMASARVVSDNREFVELDTRPSIVVYDHHPDAEGRVDLLVGRGVRFTPLGPVDLVEGGDILTSDFLVSGSVYELLVTVTEAYHEVDVQLLIGGQ